MMSKRISMGGYPFFINCAMTTIDLIFLFLLAAGAVEGFTKGGIKQLASILGLIVGLLAAKTLYATLAARLFPTFTNSVTAAQVLSFGMIWIAVPLLFALAASLLTKAMEAISLGGINRLLGAVLGVLKVFLMLCLLVYVIEYVDPENSLIEQTKKQESVLYYPIRTFAEFFLPAIKRVTEQYIFEK